MSDINNSLYILDRNFNDFGPHISSIAPVGKTEVTILDNLYNIAKLIHGRILSSISIIGGYKVYIPKMQLKDLIYAYQSISMYKFTNDIEPLIQSLRSLLASSSTDVEVAIDSRIILQMISVHNTISIGIKGIWEGVVALRFVSCSGFNKDITIDGKQQIFNKYLGKLSNSEAQIVISEIERSGQLAGIRGPRQVDARDMIADLLFSRKDSYATMHELFHTMTKQRAILREFRTDVLFCPVERYKELDNGLIVKTTITVENVDLRSTIKPDKFSNCEFILKNRSLADIDVQVAGSIGSGVISILPLQEIRVSGTSISLLTSTVDQLSITLLADIRDFNGTGGSIVSTAVKGELKEHKLMLNIFYQVIKPVIPYLNSLVKKSKDSEIFKLCISKMSDWIQDLFDNLKPANVYSGWLLTDKASEKERILYIYLLTIMLPEYLLDPTFTFTNSVGTPPYVHEYGYFVQSLKSLYE